jgi:hypothetical protein
MITHVIASLSRYCEYRWPAALFVYILFFFQHSSGNSPIVFCVE